MLTSAVVHPVHLMSTRDLASVRLMTPRLHNVLSYSVAFAVMPSVAFATGSVGGVGLLAVGLWCLHFARRSAEAAWVHRYGKPSFPWGDALVEYVYYWGLGAWIGATVGGITWDWPSALGLGTFLAAEAGNARAHRLLCNLRREDPTARSIPRGFVFEWVSCPHYLFEIMSWVGFALVVRTWAAIAFGTLGAAILAFWASQRHRAYRKEFDGQDGRALYPAERRALVPLIY